MQENQNSGACRMNKEPVREYVMKHVICYQIVKVSDIQTLGIPMVLSEDGWLESVDTEEDWSGVEFIGVVAARDGAMARVWK